LKNKLTVFGLIFLAVVFWGNSFIATKLLLTEIEPVTIIVLRLIIAAVVLSAYAVFTKKSFAIKLKSHLYILLLAAVASLHLWIQVTGLQYTTASNTGWIIGTAPVFIAVLGIIFFKEKILLVQIAGIILAIAGLILLISKGNLTSVDLITTKGDLLVLASAFTWGVYSTINKKISLSYSPTMTILYLFIFMAIFIVPFNLSQEKINSITHLSARGWLMVSFLGIFCSGVAYSIWSYALRILDSGKVGAFLYFEPFVTVVAAWVFLSENITLLMILSGLIITAGVILVNKDK
jgi:drug/metabolite transporter (DMT)-like permease